MLDMLESLCHRQQRLLGTSHYVWLRLFALMHAAFTYAALLPVSAPSERYQAWLLTGAFLACVPMLSWWERRSLSRALKGLANPLRMRALIILGRYQIGYIGIPYFTAVMVLVSVMDFERIWLYLFLTFWWWTLAALFVLPACDPLPPVAGKWRERLSKLFLRPVTSS
jgi:hypothetical protein